VILNI